MADPVGHNGPRRCTTRTREVVKITPMANGEFFLRHVRRGPGVICVASQKGHWREYPFEDSEQALALVDTYKATHDVYASMGTLPAGSASRSAENVESLRGFFIDLDCHGKAGEYESPGEALKALKTFRQDTGLPRPDYIVSSGHGLHAHWVLREPVGRETWLVTAKKLKALTELAGLKADRRVTADPARVLRVPDTFNFRDPANPMEVELLPVPGDQTELADFEKAIDAALTKYQGPASARAKAPLSRGQVRISKAVDDTPRQRAALAGMLAHISADCSYDLYRDMVWAILSLGWHDGEKLAEQWCLTAPHRFDKDSFNRVVAGHDERRSPSMGTIIHHAREGGWNG